MNQRRPAASVRILVVDDERDIRDLISALLETEGFEPIVAARGPEALEWIRQGVPSAVLLDLMMPGMDGMQVLKEARKIDANTPIVLVTAHASIGAAVEAVKSGAYDYVTKPFDNDELILTLRRAV